MRLRVLVGFAAVIMLAAPSPGLAEAFSSYWSTLSESERDFVDHVAAGLYEGERGERAASYQSLNSASKARFRAKAIDILDVKDRPKRTKKRAAEI